MHPAIRPVALLTALVATVASTWFVASANLRKGVYPLDADSIGIPIIEAGVLAALLLPAVLLLAFYRLLIAPLKRRPFARGLLFPTTLASCVLICLLSGELAYSWADREHLAIAIAYAILGLAAFAFMAADVAHLVARRRLGRGGSAA